MVFFMMLASRMIMGALLLTWPIVGHFWKNLSSKNSILFVFFVLLIVFLFTLEFLPKPIDNRIRELSRTEYRIDADSLSDFSGVTIRLAEWNGALHAIRHQCLLGYGPGLGQNALLDSYDSLGFKVGLFYKFNAHNQYLQTALDLGWVGSVLLILSIFALCYPSLSSGNRNVLWFLIFFLLCSITESTLIRQRGAVMLALFVPFLGIVTGCSGENRPQRSGEGLSD
jgi:O-antigen ligase